MKETTVDNDQDLIGQASRQLKPSYQAAIRKGLSSDEAYLAIYSQVVQWLAKKLGVSKDKTKFESRHLIQKIIREITA
jgi:hypothetical protein